MSKPRHSSSDCSVEATTSLIEGKWKGVILYHVLNATLRFGTLRRLLPAVTARMLTNQLREPEADGLIHRTVYPQEPPKVECSVSPLGRTLAPVLASLRTWGDENRPVFGRRKAPPVVA